MATTTDNNEDLHWWATQLRRALAKAPNTALSNRVRAAANAAREAHALTVPMLSAWVHELDTKQIPQSRLPKPFPNKKAQPCERCGKWVEAGQGLCERSDDDTRWIVSHPEDPGCPVVLFEGVPEGRYAIDWGTAEAEDVKFYQIKEAVLYAQASAELWEIKDTEAVAKVLAAIKVDPKAASLLYGTKLGACGVCGRTLTNQDSRDLGIGPICAGKMGW
jgi:Family of unknown function (DUF6011)